MQILAPVRGIAMLTKCRNQNRKVLRLLAFFFTLLAIVLVSTYLFLAPIFHSDFIDSRILFPMRMSESYQIRDRVGAVAAVSVKIPVSNSAKESVKTVKAIQTVQAIQAVQAALPAKIEQGDKPLFISAALYRQPKAKGIVIYSHGTGGCIDIRFSNQNPRLGFFINSGFDILMYDYQGYGRSQGKASLRNLKPDCLAVYNYALSLGYQPQEIVLYGESLGGGVSCLLAGLKPVKAIILDCTFTSPARLAREIAPISKIYPDFLFPEPKLDNLQYLKSDHPPCLMITGLRDTYIPPSQTLKLKRAAKPDSYLLMLPNSGHCVLADCDLPLYELALKKFLKELI